MLVSKIKPCLCKYKHIQTVKLRMAHSISYSLFDGIYYSDRMAIVPAMHHSLFYPINLKSNHF